MNTTINFYLIFIIFLKTSNCSTVENVRKSVIDYFGKHPNEAYKSDLDIIANKDWLVERFAQRTKDETKIKDKIISTLKHWKELNLNDLNDQYFPSELYATGAYILFGENRKHIPMATMYGRCIPPWLVLDPKFIDLELKRLEYLFRNMTLESGPKNWHVNAFWKNAKLDVLHPRIWNLLLSLIKLTDENTPLSYLVTDVSETAKKFILGFTKFLSPEIQTRINFIDGSELSKYISSDQIPKFANGSDTSYNRMPSGVKSGKCLPQFKISAKEWEDFKDKNIDCIIEGMALSDKLSVDDYLNIGCK